MKQLRIRRRNTQGKLVARGTKRSRLLRFAERLEVRRVLAAPVALDDFYNVSEDGELSVGIEPVTRLQMTSDVGDFVGQGQTYDFTTADGQFLAARNFDNGVNVTFNGGPGNSWFLKFAAPNAVDLTPGMYAGATRWPFNADTDPGLDISGQGRGCNTLTGEFNVEQADYNPDGTVAAFSASFEQHCEGVTPALHGTIQVNASAATSTGVIANDTDADGDPLTAVLVAGPTSGELTLHPSGAFTYTPEPNFHGTDTFMYLANDGTSDSNVATVVINVDPVNDAPVAEDYSATTQVDTLQAGQLVASDVDLDELDFLPVSLPANGVLDLNLDGSFVYTPNAGFAGTDSFTFVTNDGAADSNIATAVIEVEAPNQAPVTNDDAYTVDEDGVLVISSSQVETRLQMTSDPGDFVGQGQTYDFTTADGQFLAARNHDNGVSVTFNGGTGNSWFMQFVAPNAVDLAAGVYTGATRWPFNADTDPGLDISGQGRGCNTLTGQFTVHVADFDAEGFVEAFSASFEQHCEGFTPALYGTIQVNASAGSQGVLANDTDADGDPFSAILVSGPASGSLALSDDGTFTYTPDANFNGVDSFSYKASDGEAESNIATVTIAVNPVDDPPKVDDQIFSIAENAANGASVGLVSAGEVDGEVLVYSIAAGNDDGIFAVDSQTGAITIADNALLDYETTAQYNLTVQVADSSAAALADTAIVTIDVTDVTEVVPILSLDRTDLFEFEGPAATMGHVSRTGDLSEPLTVFLTSSDETELTVPGSVVIPSFEASVSFLVDLVDDTILDGDQTVAVTAEADGVASEPVFVTVYDVEEVTVSFDQLAGSPGDTLTATIAVSTTDRVDPLVVTFESKRPAEIASEMIVVDPAEQFVTFPVPVLEDAYLEGPHSVRIFVSAEGYAGDEEILEIFNPGVTTLVPAADGQARDADQDGLVFEEVTTQSQEISTQAASPSGSFGESRGIIEFDPSSIPEDAIVESAVVTLDIGGSAYTPGNDLVMDVFAYAGDGVVDSSDANETGTTVGQLTILTEGSSLLLGSYAIPLDLAAVQSVVDSGGHLGILTTIQSGRLTYFSQEFFRDFSRPALHLSLAYPPVLTANALTVGEGETVTLDAGLLAATDRDSDEASLVFTVFNVSGGEFLVEDGPATSFTQAQLTAGQVTFVHGGGELAPAYDVTVSDGTYSAGPESASISFTNVNDNAPVILTGQAFTVSEDAANGTVLGTIAFSDSDLPGDSFTMTIPAGNEDGVFAIDDGGTLSVVNNTNLDFDSASAYTLTIQIFDGVHTSTEQVTLDVLDVEFTKFYVVDDGNNGTFEYEADGALVANYSLAGGNSTPRGATADADADTVWVVDNDGLVYVYDTGGAVIGSWTATDLSQPEGIATDGADIWIVDQGLDRVLKFNGGAAFASGMHAADASFNLDKSNRDPAGVTTDGVHLWVVNGRNGSDHVFKYTVAGVLVGKWQLDSRNGRPEGITLDPADVDSLWIVDRDADQVFQYTGGTAWTSGNRVADAVFDLAAGNLDPRGIADPPPPSGAIRPPVLRLFAEDSLAAAGAAHMSVDSLVRQMTGETLDEAFSPFELPVAGREAREEPPTRRSRNTPWATDNGGTEKPSRLEDAIDVLFGDFDGDWRDLDGPRFAAGASWAT